MDRKVKDLIDTIVLGFPSAQKGEVSFNRAELEAILRVYGFKVASGEWRDYAIDHLKDRAVFSIFRRAGEAAFYRIEKIPENSRKQGAYSIIATDGFILKRGHELKNLLKVLDKDNK